MIENLPTNAEDTASITELERALEKEVATHSSILAWEIPWREEPGGLQSLGSQRVGNDLSDSAPTKSSLLPLTQRYRDFPLNAIPFRRVLCSQGAGSLV